MLNVYNQDDREKIDDLLDDICKCHGWYDYIEKHNRQIICRICKKEILFEQISPFTEEYKKNTIIIYEHGLIHYEKLKAFI